MSLCGTGVSRVGPSSLVMSLLNVCLCVCDLLCGAYFQGTRCYFSAIMYIISTSVSACTSTTKPVWENRWEWPWCAVTQSLPADARNVVIVIIMANYT